MKIVYMGTPEFAVNALCAIIQNGHEVVAVFTQPDRPKGRGKALAQSPVKEKAIELNLPCYQPEKIREKENVELIQKMDCDAIVVAAFGQILPESILNIPRLGCINIHASLLPRYRGAAPIERCIIDGEKKTGVTTMNMAKGLDTGDIIDSMEMEIAADETGGSLREKLAVMGAELITKTLDKLADNTATRTPQKDEESCYAAMLTRETGRLDFSRDAASLERLVRGLNPKPGAYTSLNGKTIRIFKTRVSEMEGSSGEIIEVTKKSFTVACGNKSLVIEKLQPEGKKPMDTAAFLNGCRLTTGTRLGE